MVQKLIDENLLQAHSDAVENARMIDCVWFKNGRLMPAVMEVEHTTNITSGLTRMKKFYGTCPRLQNVRWAIVAPENRRRKVMKEVNQDMFKEMQVKFFPYNSVIELHSLIKRREPRGINDEFLDCFMEDCVMADREEKLLPV